MPETAVATPPSTIVSVEGIPRFLRFTGTLAHPPSSPKVRMLFSLYEGREGQTPLWQEAQDVQADAQGHFTVLLGVTRKDGLPKTLFIDGKAHWLGMQLQPGQGQEAANQQPSADEEKRVLLVGVPYALKAADADTLGGLPASAFVHTKANPKTGKTASTREGAIPDANSTDPANALANAAPTVTGTTNYIARWISATALGNSFLFQTSTSIGLGTTSPVAKFHVVGPTPTTAIDGYNNATAGSTFGILGQADSTAGTGVYGKAAAATGATVGVRGVAASTTGTGLLGWDTATSGATSGVVGQVSSRLGTAGVFNNTAGGKILSGRNNGSEAFSVDGAGNISANGNLTLNNSNSGRGNVYVGTVNASGFPAVTAYADSGDAIVAQTYDASAIHAYGGQSYSTAAVNAEGGQVAGVIATNTDSNGIIPTLSASSGVNTPAGQRAEAVPVIYASGPNGHCVIDNIGDLTCTGTKSAAVNVAGRQLAMYAVESPENWFEDFGSGKLASGIATVKLEPTFTRTVNSAQNYYVFLTPNGDCKGLYISRKTATSFEVRELGSGQSSVTFDFRIVARRRGYENVRMADVTKEMQKPVFRTKTGQVKQIAVY